MRVQTAADFLEAFCARVRAARKARGLTQAEMANALRIGAEAYRAYEKRTPLPHFLVEQFARVTGIEIEYLFTGRQPRRGGLPPELPGPGPKPPAKAAGPRQTDGNLSVGDR